MPLEQSNLSKPDSGNDRPFPWNCRRCGKREVQPMLAPDFAVEIRHEGVLHGFTVPELIVPTCRSCGERWFTETVDQQINDAFRRHLNLLSPAQIRAAMERIELSEKEVSQRLGIAEATLSRWLTDTQIQSRSLDNLMRAYFAFPDVRTALCGVSQNALLGTFDVETQSSGTAAVN